LKSVLPVIKNSEINVTDTVRDNQLPIWSIDVMPSAPTEQQDASAGSSGAQQIVPNRFEKACVKSPCSIMLLTVLACFTMIGLLVATGLPAFSQGGFNSREALTQKQVPLVP
jgi:hypothetical protein